VSFVHFSRREIHCKVVYYGPGLGGKTTNLQFIHERAPASAKGKLVSLATENDRTLFFDFMPLDLGHIRGFKVRFHLYTVPGQVFYAASRRLILRGVDGVVFVVDAHPERFDEGLDSLDDLYRNLHEQGQDAEQLPIVIQFNKRDLPNAVPIWRLQREFNPEGLPSFEAVATKGFGVLETLKACCTRVLKQLETREPAPSRQTGRQVGRL